MVYILQHHKCSDLSWLLKVLWWLKVYPTEQTIKNQRASPSHFRSRLWPILEALKICLPEVCLWLSSSTFETNFFFFFFFFFFFSFLRLPFHLRWFLNETFDDFADLCSFIIDTTTVQTLKPELGHGDFDRYAFHFWNQHKKKFGVKLELLVATQRRPLPIGVSVVPAGWHDMAIARLPGGVLSRMRPGERALGDPGYHGEPDKIYAPPRKNMLGYVPELDTAELTLQRRVEMANARIKSFKCLGTVYRKGAVRAFRDLETIGIVVPKLIYLDVMLNQERYGLIHVRGPTPRLERSVGKRRPIPRVRRTGHLRHAVARRIMARQGSVPRRVLRRIN